MHKFTNGHYVFYLFIYYFYLFKFKYMYIYIIYKIWVKVQIFKVIVKAIMI